MVGPTKNKKEKQAASRPLCLQSTSYAADLGKVVKMPGSFWNLRGDEASELVVAGAHIRRNGDLGME